MNEINVIAPYKYHGQWVFDDPRVGLLQEPFVAGADTWLDRVVADIPGAERGFRLIFSGSPFPGHQYRLDWRREEGGGNWYHSADLDMEGWLCPAQIFHGGAKNALCANQSTELIASWRRDSQKLLSWNGVRDARGPPAILR
jgi:hypothetical protein